MLSPGIKVVPEKADNTREDMRGSSTHLSNAVGKATQSGEEVRTVVKEKWARQQGTHRRKKSLQRQEQTTADRNKKEEKKGPFDLVQRRKKTRTNLVPSSASPRNALVQLLVHPTHSLPSVDAILISTIVTVLPLSVLYRSSMTSLSSRWPKFVTCYVKRGAK